MALLKALCTAAALGAASGFVVPGGRRVTTVTPPRHHPHRDSPTTPVPSVLGLGLGRRSAGLVTLDGRKTGNTDRANKRSSSRRGSSKKKAPSSSSTSGADRAGGDEEEDAWGLGLEEGDEVEEVIMAMDADGEADEEEEVEEWELNEDPMTIIRANEVVDEVRTAIHASAPDAAVVCEVDANTSWLLATVILEATRSSTLAVKSFRLAQHLVNHVPKSTEFLVTGQLHPQLSNPKRLLGFITRYPTALTVDTVEDATALNGYYGKSISRSANPGNRYDKVSKSRAAFLKKKRAIGSNAKGTGRERRERVAQLATAEGGDGSENGNGEREGDGGVGGGVGVGSGGSAAEGSRLPVFLRGDALATRESIAAVAALSHLRIRGTLGANAAAAAFARDCLVAEGALEADGEWKAVAEHEHEQVLGAEVMGERGDLADEDESEDEQSGVGTAEDESEGEFEEEVEDEGVDGRDLQRNFESLRWLSISAAVEL